VGFVSPCGEHPLDETVGTDVRQIYACPLYKNLLGGGHDVDERAQHELCRHDDLAERQAAVALDQEDAVLRLERLSAGEMTPARV